MLRTLVVPLDGSAEAEQALPYAIRLASVRGGRVALMRAALRPPPSGMDREYDQQTEVQEAEAYLAGVADKLASRVPVATWVGYGRAAAEIRQGVRDLNADAVVMATHGRTGLAHLVYGSVAEAVLSESAVPVLLVQSRPGEAVATPFDPTSARILVPLDGSTFAAAALPIALEVLGAAGELVLVSVATKPDHVERDEQGRVRAYLDQQEDSVKREAADYLRAVAAQLKERQPDLNVTWDVRVGDPAEGIIAAEVDRVADLVVMASHGRTGIGRALMGSVAGAVLRSGSTPVMIVKPPKAGGVNANDAALTRVATR